MQYRLLGASGIKLSSLTLGTMNFGAVGPFGRLGGIDASLAGRFIAMCSEAGVNSIDTSNIYSFGASETLLGKALQGQRNRFVVGTKVRFGMGSDPNDAGLSRLNIIRACEASLRRLNTDWIDIYWLHAWDGQTALEETLRALEDLLRSGKIRSIGVSNFSAWHLAKILSVAEQVGLPRVTAQQIHYTLQAREAEHELIPLGIDANVPLVVWSPLAGGLLSGTYRRDNTDPEGTRRAAGWKEPPVHDLEQLYAIVDTLTEIAGECSVSVAQVALAWVLARKPVSTAIIGARTEDQLRDNLAAATLDLSAEQLARLEAVSRRPLPYPYWHQVMTARDRLSQADLALLEPYLSGPRLHA